VIGLSLKITFFWGLWQKILTFGLIENYEVFLPWEKENYEVFSLWSLSLTILSF